MARHLCGLNAHVSVCLESSVVWALVMGCEYTKSRENISQKPGVTCLFFSNVNGANIMSASFRARVRHSGITSTCHATTSAILSGLMSGWDCRCHGIANKDSRSPIESFICLPLVTAFASFYPRKHHPHLIILIN